MKLLNLRMKTLDELQMILVESALWGVYGLHHGDPATTTLAVVGTAGAVAMLARKAVAGLCPRSVDGCLVSTP